MSTPFTQNCQKIKTFSPLEHKFTEVLRSIALTPKKLYNYGKLPKNRPKCAAIVGARKYTKYGEEVTYQLAYELAKRGVVVISGLAYGIDSIAHRGALDAGGITIAVLGTPIDYIYPKAHQGLAQEILDKNGCIISELAPGAKYYPSTTFLQRNRLISGLSDVVIVTEAAVKSGSLNTATHALEQGKDLFAAPGDVYRLTSVGCNRLIQQGAYVYTGVGDVLDVLFPDAKRRQQKLIVGDTPEETAILKLLAQDMRDGEKIIAHLSMSASVFNQTITMLEIKGRVRSLGANCWMLK